MKWTRGTTQGHKEAFGVMDAFALLIVVMVSWSYTYAKTYKVIVFKDM